MSAGVFLLALLLVSVGGAAGSLARWGIRVGGARLQARRGTTPRSTHWATFAANVVACLMLGLIVARLGSATGSLELLYLLLAAGFCGGLSTLSTAALDVVELARRGAIAISVAYLLLSVGSGMLALWVGLVIGQ